MAGLWVWCIYTVLVKVRDLSWTAGSPSALLTPALVEYRNALTRPSSSMGARDPNSGPQACTLFQLSHSPDLEYCFQKRSLSFKYPIQY